MTEEIDRDEFMNLCDRLMAEDDGEALAAAREIRAKLTAAGLSWNDILAPQEVEVDIDEDVDEEVEDVDEEVEDVDEEVEDIDEELREAGDDEADDDVEAEDEEETADAEEASTANAEALATIKRLLERSDISASLREELDDYKTDIKEGEFDAGDRKYVKSLAARLKSKK